jgi:DNA-binding XRE family transcriptional regulator
MADITPLGRQIKIYRATHDLTQSALAAKWGVSATAISLLETGKPCPQLSPQKLARLAKAVLASLVLLLLLPAPASAQGLVIPSSVFVASAAADLVTTRQAIGRGAHEANPIMGQGAGQQLAIKALGTTATILIARADARRGHPTRAKILLYVGSGFWFAVAAHNHQVGRR